VVPARVLREREFKMRVAFIRLKLSFTQRLVEYSGLSVPAELLENAFGLTKASDNSAKLASEHRLSLASERAA
jgi:hypothetical protein